MKQLCKRSLAVLLLLVMLVGYFSGITIRASAASYTYNWGTREDVADQADFTRSTAEEWYAAEGTSYEELCQYTGSSTVSSVTSSELYQKLRSLMRGAVTDTTSYEDIKTLCKYTDCQNGGGAISSFYSGNSIGPSWDGTWNREHTWPNSKGDANGSGENDIFMLRPTSYAENGSRGNTAYGEGSSYYNPNEESGGTYDLRGDVARIILFVYVRWQDYTSSSAVLYGTSGVIESRTVLLKWMEEDPVDTWELGRNDSCQSITGTRNVFVDYPELAFLMLGDEIPDNYTSPSGVGSAVSYNITATSNNTSYGTVSLSGKTITATPKTGYYASGYTVTSGTATVTQDGNKFTVSASSDCTIRINFAAKTAVTLTFMENGVTGSTMASYGGDSVTLPSNTNTVADGYSFLGWTDSLVSDTTTKPTIYTAGTSVTATNKTYYAVYSYSVGGTGVTEWTLKDISEITANDVFVITSATSSTVYALPNTEVSKAPTAVPVTVSDDKLASEPASNLLWNLGGTANAWEFYPDGVTSRWLASSNENNGMSVGTGTNKAYKINSGYLYNNAVSRYVGVYTNNPDWRCYTTTGGNIANQTLGFYVKSESGTMYYSTSTIVCDHANTTNVAVVAATCTETGYTAGVYCNDCETYISGHEVVAALGHSYNAGVITTAPTCTAVGVKTFTCSVCGDSYTESVVATGHSWNSGVVTTAATCTANGVKTYTCQTCGTTKTESVAATGHSYNAVVTPPTATEQGYTTYTCTVCGDSYQGEYVHIVKFSVPSGVAAVPSKECGEDGITLPSAGVPAGEYEYVFAGWVTAEADNVTDKPEILSAGSTYKATANITLHALYTYKIADGNGPADEYALYSGELTEGDYIITYNGSALVAADADSSGRMDYTTVTVSGDAIQSPDATIIWHIAPDGNYWTIYNEENAVYAAGTGSKNKATVLTTLTDYGRWTATGDSTYEFKNLGNANKGVNALLRCNGTYGFACYSTSTGGALSLYKATSGSTTYYTTVIGAKCDHNYETVVTNPTCTQSGYTTYTCTVCGDQYTADVTAATGHTEVADAAVEATCQSTGLTEGSHCSECGEILVAQTVIAAVECDFQPVVTPPTCTERGYSTYICIWCGEFDEVTDYVNATGHSFSAGVCTACGEKEAKVVETWNICLGDNIGVNFVLNVDETDEVSFTLNYTDAINAVKDGNTYSIYLPAVYSTSQISITVNGETLEETYSVEKYAEYILDEANGYSKATKNLVNAMLYYCEDARYYFGMDGDYTGLVQGTAIPTGSTKVAIADNLDGIDFYGASLLHRNRIAVRFYFTGSVDGLTFRIGNKEYTPVAKGDKYYVDVANINPQDMGDIITVEVSDGANTLTVGYSPLIYIVRMYEKENSSEATKNLVFSLYNYYLAAVDYLAENS